MKVSLILMISLLTLQSGCRLRSDTTELAAKAPLRQDDDVFYVYHLEDGRVLLKICTVAEMKASQGECQRRELMMSYVVLRKHLIAEVKRMAREAQLKLTYHENRIRELEAKGEEYQAESAFHWYELRFYQQMKDSTRRDLEALHHLESRLSEGMSYYSTKSRPSEFDSEPLSEVLRTVFLRERVIFSTGDKLTWRFVSNDTPFFGAQRLCEHFFPGYRLPTALEAKTAVEKGMAQTSFFFAARQHYAELSGVKSFWTADLPNLEAVRKMDPSYLENRAWAQNFMNDSIDGQMLAMQFRATLVCVGKDL